MILLDTNVLSEIMNPVPDQRVVAWLNGLPRISTWTTSITILEVRFGLQSLPEGKCRLALTQGFEALLQTKIERRIAVFDWAAAEHAADLMSARQRVGRPVDLRDTMIAGIALAANASLATRNTKDFADLRIQVINPWLEG